MAEYTESTLLTPIEDEHALQAISMETIGQIVTEMMRPVMQTIGKLLENNTAALEQLSASQQIQNDRLEALERQIRLNTPVTSKQVSYLNGAIRDHARALLDERGVDDAKAVTKLSGHIRRSLLSRYGIGNIREIPRHEYEVAMQTISLWKDQLTVRDVVKGVGK